MRSLILLTILVLPLYISAQKVDIIKFNDLEAFMNKDNDTTYVINFWATWCVPCMKEMPAFESINAKYADEKVKVLLISLDFDSDVDKKIIPYMHKNNIRSTVMLLDESDANAWIDKVSPEWSGAIPGTLIVNNKKRYRKFYEKEFIFRELENIIKPLI